MEKLVRRIKNIFRKPGVRSYAQCGEDLIIRMIFDHLGIETPLYIDIGAHHPTLFSNTYLFYKNGSSGICIEPDPTLCSHIAKKRRRDICLNIGISDQGIADAPYYVMTAQTLNTFAEEDVKKSIQNKTIYGTQKVERVEHIKLVPIDEILKKYFSNYPDLLSIDTEGFDERIVKGINFNQNRPKVVCVETLEEEGGMLKKNQELIEYIVSKNYLVYADTYINTIFVDNNIWKNK